MNNYLEVDVKDVKRFRVYLPGQFDRLGNNREADVVYATDYDAALSKLAAETLRADTAEAERDDLKKHQEILLQGAKYARSRRDYWLKRGDLLKNELAINTRHLDRMIEHSDSLEEKIAATEQRVSELEKVLDRIARPHDCGCWPCMGSCVSQEALQITVDEMRDRAGAALNPTPKEESHE